MDYSLYFCRIFSALSFNPSANLTHLLFKHFPVEMLKGKCGKILGSQVLLETAIFFTILSTDKIQRSCGLEPLFHNIFLYYYRY